MSNSSQKLNINYQYKLNILDHETKFKGGEDPNASEYYQSLIGFPILMAILSVLVIVALQV